MIASVDPRTGVTVEEIDVPTEELDVDVVCAGALRAEVDLRELGRAGRAGMLRSMADALEERRAELVAVADRETGLGPQRMNGELSRTAFQLRLFADVLDDGAYLEATIDHAGPTAMGPRPDLRRMLLPLGPVAVFGASNFPFAFSVPGGDTASALAAGCPVVAKVHEAHPATSVLCRDVLLAGARAVGVTSPVVSLVFSREAATDLVAHEAVTAVGFTGSLHAGRMLADLAAARPSPIPFYGELGALNAFVACPAAARDRGAEIGTGLATSFTLGVGQFCTKPGVALIPQGPDGDAIRTALVDHVRASSSEVMLSERTARSYAEGIGQMSALEGVEVLARGAAGPDAGWWGAPILLRATPEAVEGPLTEECFGPVIVLVEYGDPDEVPALLSRFGPALTATVHADEADSELAARLLDRGMRTVGRVVWNGYPTGVAVSWAMHHGGPYPATTNALHTSVGASAIRRWLRPVSLQDVPAELLPDELRESPSAPLPRRIDGVLVLP